MSDAEIANAILNSAQALPAYRKEYGGEPKKDKQILMKLAHAIMQLWHDLEEEERASVKQKALT